MLESRAEQSFGMIESLFSTNLLILISPGRIMAIYHIDHKDEARMQ